MNLNEEMLFLILWINSIVIFFPFFFLDTVIL